MKADFRINNLPQGGVLEVSGDWNLTGTAVLDLGQALQSAQLNKLTAIDFSNLRTLDTAGAFQLKQLIAHSGSQIAKLDLKNLSAQAARILEITPAPQPDPPSIQKRAELTLLGKVGRESIEILKTAQAILRFVGLSAYELGCAFISPRKFRWKEFCTQIENAGLNALPIVALVNFLIGIVIAYLSGVQIEKYGANIFIVDGVGLAVCRELSPILVAIIIAGRSGSAFTAQLGSMKMNEETDALFTLGLSPMRVLVLPRIFALVVVMPLLVFAGDLAGIAGGMAVADLRLGVTGATFIERLQVVLLPKSVLVGLFKAPFFAFFIGSIACRLGLSVENNSQSLGENTTKTVVQSIVAVILLNAMFAIIFSELKI